MKKYTQLLLNIASYVGAFTLISRILVFHVVWLHVALGGTYGEDPQKYYGLFPFLRQLASLIAAIITTWLMLLWTKKQVAYLGIGINATVLFRCMLFGFLVLSLAALSVYCKTLLHDYDYRFSSLQELVKRGSDFFAFGHEGNPFFASPAFWAVIIFCLYLLAASMWEELVFRGFLLRYISEWLNPVWVLLCLSLVFGVGHMQESKPLYANLAALNAFMFSCFLGFLFLRF